MGLEPVRGPYDRVTKAALYVRCIVLRGEENREIVKRVRRSSEVVTARTAAGTQVSTSAI